MIIVGITSPVHGQAGQTTIALLSSILMAGIQKKRVLLLHASDSSRTFFSYLGLDSLEDKTATPSQIHTMIRERQVTPTDARTYCVPLLPEKMTLDVYGNSNKGEDLEIISDVQDFMMKNREYDMVVIDLDLPSYTQRYKTLAEKCTVLLCCVTQSVNVENRMNEVRDLILPSRHIAEKRVLYICNRFSADIGNSGVMLKKLSVKNDCLVTVPYSPYLVKLSNAGKLYSLWESSLKKVQPQLYRGLIEMTKKICQKCGYKFFSAGGGT